MFLHAAKRFFSSARMQWPRRNPYEIMDLPANAAAADIKKTYSRLVMELHPDRNGNSSASTDRFHQLQMAYGILRSPERRQEFHRAMSVHRNDYQALLRSLQPASSGAPSASYNYNAYHTAAAEYFRQRQRQGWQEQQERRQRGRRETDFASGNSGGAEGFAHVHGEPTTKRRQTPFRVWMALIGGFVLMEATLLKWMHESAERRKQKQKQHLQVLHQHYFSSESSRGAIQTDAPSSASMNGPQSDVSLRVKHSDADYNLPMFTLQDMKRMQEKVYRRNQEQILARQDGKNKATMPTKEHPEDRTR